MRPSKTFQGADLVIVNTCGFIDDAIKESLDTIGEALAENGKVIVTGCLGAKTRPTTVTIWCANASQVCWR
jgi:ribosomal protein S12 methylthiotransferase